MTTVISRRTKAGTITAIMMIVSCGRDASCGGSARLLLHGEW